MGKIRSASVIAAFVLAGIAVGAPVAAAPPPNDTAAGATPIAALPFFDAVDTSEATTDQAELDADRAVPRRAGGRAGGVVRGAGDDRRGGGSHRRHGERLPGGDSDLHRRADRSGVRGCAVPARSSGPVTNGQTIYIMVFGDTVGAPGPTLRLSIQVVRAPDGRRDCRRRRWRHGQDRRRSGVRHNLVYRRRGVRRLFGTLRQRAGRVFVEGPIFVSAIVPVCDGSPITWTASVTAPLGLFKGGNATATVTAFACTVNFDCAAATVETSVGAAR